MGQSLGAVCARFCLDDGAAIPARRVRVAAEDAGSCRTHERPEEGFTLPMFVTLLSGERLHVEGLGADATACRLRQRLLELRPVRSGMKYELLSGTRLLRDGELLWEPSMGEALMITAIVKNAREVIGASSVLEVLDDGRLVRMVQEPTGQDYGWVCYEAVPTEGSLSWQVTATNFTGATMVGVTTNAEDLDAIPGRQRNGLHVEYRRSGNVRFYTRGDRPYLEKHSEIQSGESVELTVDTVQGVISFTKGNEPVARFEHSTETPIIGQTWYPCIALDEVNEEAALLFCD